MLYLLAALLSALALELEYQLEDQQLEQVFLMHNQLVDLLQAQV